jgi:hypothetical protein
VVRYAVVRDPDGPRFADADIRRRGADGPAQARLTPAVRSAAAAQSSAVPTLVEYGVSMLLVPGRVAPELAGLAELDGVSRVPTDDAVVFRADAPAGALTVLDPATATRAQAGEGLPAQARPRPLPTRADGTTTRLPEGPAGRLLVLAEPADAGWQAAVDGRRLEPVRAYGWAQAWRLPAGAGQLVVGRDGDHRGWWVGAELAIVVVLALAALPGRRSRNPGQVTA